jgi:hypothetical protein
LLEDVMGRHITYGQGQGYQTDEVLHDGVRRYFRATDIVLAAVQDGNVLVYVGLVKAMSLYIPALLDRHGYIYALTKDEHVMAHRGHGQ